MYIFYGCRNRKERVDLDEAKRKMTGQYELFRLSSLHLLPSLGYFGCIYKIQVVSTTPENAELFARPYVRFKADRTSLCLRQSLLNLNVSMQKHIYSWEIS